MTPIEITSIIGCFTLSLLLILSMNGEKCKVIELEATKRYAEGLENILQAIFTNIVDNAVQDIDPELQYIVKFDKKTADFEVKVGYDELVKVDYMKHGDLVVAIHKALGKGE